MYETRVGGVKTTILSKGSRKTHIYLALNGAYIAQRFQDEKYLGKQEYSRLDEAIKKEESFL